MGTEAGKLRKTRWVIVIPQTPEQQGTAFELWVDEIIAVNSTPAWEEDRKVPVGLAGAWHDWVNVGKHLRSAMQAVDREESVATA